MISEQEYETQASALGLKKAHLKAIATVESNGNGFLDTGEPKILFERHKFYQQLAKNRGAAFAATVAKTDPDICNTTAGGYLGGKAEHRRLQRAVAIDRNSALEACSWGAFQVMGFNWQPLGYSGIQALVNDAYTDAGQLRMLAKFLKANPAIITAAKAEDWARVARLYNGPAYVQNRYDDKLREAYRKFSV